MLTAVAVLTTGCTTKGTARAECVVRPAADVVPKAGVLFGVNLDWGHETLSDYAVNLGRHPAVTVAFAEVPLNVDARANLAAAVNQVRANGGSLLLTLEPAAGLAVVTDEVAADVADLTNSINREGVPVILRFAHEMNGSWYAWGQQPAEYISTFRRVAHAIHERAPGTGMMWAPNNADGYPFTGGASSAAPGSPDFKLLDTNGDGTITLADHPYAPYYPGDDAVDWVGMSLYHWGSAYPWGENEMPEEGKFVAQLTGTYIGAQGDERAAPDFYQVYGVDHAKPVAIPETGAFVIHRGDDAGELAIKQAWWRQVFSADIAVRFPNLKMINWFEWDKLEAEVHQRVDWTVVNDAPTRHAFTADLPAWLDFSDGEVACPVPTN
ncbi:glycoside hydrolase family 26 protein [Subtercola frigoramans]|uniref:glycoside hydrolase family 26 protein n=1 Tax=Subtercola frigoramans TaxID=120298 RepID=UPI0027DE9837|nr:glycosyl hydrolase [Subtercola frigoramans]